MFSAAASPVTAIPFDFWVKRTHYVMDLIPSPPSLDCCSIFGLLQQAMSWHKMVITLEAPPSKCSSRGAPCIPFGTFKMFISHTPGTHLRCSTSIGHRPLPDGVCHDTRDVKRHVRYATGVEVVKDATRSKVLNVRVCSDMFILKLCMDSKVLHMAIMFTGTALIDAVQQPALQTDRTEPSPGRLSEIHIEVLQLPLYRRLLTTAAGKPCGRRRSG